MTVFGFFMERLRHFGVAAKWLAIIMPMAAVVGTLCAGFLWALDWVTEQRLAHPELLFGLPVAGIVVALAYHWFGRAAEGGNNLIVEQIHEPGGGVPRRMAPLIVIATVVTSHLFGALRGTRGDGGAARRQHRQRLRASCFGCNRVTCVLLLMTGIAAGFGAVFGTPVAGAVFALEVLAVGSGSNTKPWCHALAGIDLRVIGFVIAGAFHHVAYLWSDVSQEWPVTGGTAFHIDPFLLAKVAARRRGVRIGLGWCSPRRRIGLHALF